MNNACRHLTMTFMHSIGTMIACYDLSKSSWSVWEFL